MTDADDPQATSGTGGVFGDIGRLTVGLQEESLRATRQWSEGVLALLREQAESNRAVMRAVQSSLEAMEAALTSQEETNRALRESLDAYREAVNGVGSAQRRTAELVQASLGNVVAVQQQQLQSAQSLMRSAAPTRESVAGMMNQWIDAYRRLFETFLPGSGTGRPRDDG